MPLTACHPNMFDYDIHMGDGWYYIEFELVWDRDQLVPNVEAVWKDGNVPDEWTQGAVLDAFYKDWQKGYVKLWL